MSLTDLLFQYINEAQNEELNVDAAYQEAKAARTEAERALVFALTPKQRQMFHSYREQANYVDALEFRHMFSCGTIQFALTPPPRTTGQPRTPDRAYPQE